MIRVSPGMIAALVHVVALIILFRTETILVAKLAFVLAWVFLNCLFLSLLRRPAIAAVLSLAFIAGLILASQFKHSILFMTVVFVDVMVIDWDSIRFLLSILPGFKLAVVLGLAVSIGDHCVLVARRKAKGTPPPARARRAGQRSCLLSGVALAVPAERWEVFYNGDYVSKFFRSAVETAAVLSRQSILESDARAADRLEAAIAVPTARTPAAHHSRAR